MFDRRITRGVAGDIPARWKLLIAASVVISALSFLGAAALFNRLGGDAVRDCDRSNDVRRVINERTPLHEADARNLARLTQALIDNRELEALAIERVGPEFKAYARILRRAGEQDARILDDALKVRFRHVSVSDCDVIVKSG